MPIYYFVHFFESLFFALCLHKQTQKIFCNKNRQKGFKKVRAWAKMFRICIISVYSRDTKKILLYSRFCPYKLFIIIMPTNYIGFLSFHYPSQRSIPSVLIFNFIIHVFAEWKIHTNTLDTFVLIISIRLVWSFYTQEYGTNGATDSLTTRDMVGWYIISFLLQLQTPFRFTFIV